MNERASKFEHPSDDRYSGGGRARQGAIFPTEILALIFRACLRGERVPLPICYSCSTTTMPWVLGQVCSTWKKVSEDDPELWSSLTLSYNNVRDKAAFTRRVKGIIFPRTKLEPISLTYSRDEYTNPKENVEVDSVISMLVMPNLTQFQELSLSLASKALVPVTTINSPSALFASLESLELEFLRTPYDEPAPTMFGPHSTLSFDHAPMLRKVNIKCRRSCSFVGDNPLSLPWSQLTELKVDGGLPYTVVMRFLPSCTQLTHCHLYIDGYAVPCSQITLPRLRSISLEFNVSESSSSLLEALILPALTDFRLRVDSLNPIYLQEILLTFLTRSECRLECFDLGVPFASAIKDISVVLEAMPHVRKLYLPIFNPLTIPVIQRMADGEFLPQLEGLHCGVISLPMTLDMLDVRRSSGSLGARGSYKGIRCLIVWGSMLQSICECND